MPNANPANPLPEVRDADAPPAVPVEQADESLVALLDRVADPDGDSRWDRSTKRTVLVILLVALVFIIYISRPVIPMILIAAILAYLLNPIVNAAERVRIPRAGHHTRHLPAGHRPLAAGPHPLCSDADRSAARPGFV